MFKSSVPNRTDEIVYQSKKFTILKTQFLKFTCVFENEKENLFHTLTATSCSKEQHNS
jgi:hypothetical protein